MNLFQLPKQVDDQEIVDILYQKSLVRVERIVSTGQSSPDHFFYDQEEDELVMLIQGEARLYCEGLGEVSLKGGDVFLIPAHMRHQVKETSTEPACIWLCVFCR